MQSLPVSSTVKHDPRFNAIEKRETFFGNYSSVDVICYCVKDRKLGKTRSDRVTVKRDPALSKIEIWIKRQETVLYFVKRDPALSHSLITGSPTSVISTQIRLA